MRTLLLVPVVMLGATGCLSSGPSEQGSAAITSYCEATIAGVGRVDIENEYLPGVLRCENAGAPPDALRALAVAGRSYLYYQLDNGIVPVADSGDQDFRCGRPPSQAERQAVRDTAGIVMRWRGAPVAGFYVAGALQEPPDCEGGQSGPYAWTESAYVTDNDGLEGDEVVQTALGWVSPRNPHNRGCMSENGSTCLARAGTPWDEILHHYYGEDIELVAAVGPCTTEPVTNAAPTSPVEPPPMPTEPAPAVCAADRYEPNDRSRQATPLAGSLEDLSLCEGDAADWFRVSDADGQVVVDLDVASAPPDLDLDLEVYDTRAPYAWRAGRYSRRTPGEHLTLTVAPGSSVWLRVVHARGPEAPRYSLLAR